MRFSCLDQVRLSEYHVFCNSLHGCLQCSAGRFHDALQLGPLMGSPASSFASSMALEEAAWLAALPEEVRTPARSVLDQLSSVAELITTSLSQTAAADTIRNLEAARPRFSLGLARRWTTRQCGGAGRTGGPSYPCSAWGGQSLLIDLVKST